MNNKESIMNQIINIVVGCCATQVDDAGTMSLNRDEVLGSSRKENVVMTRAILCAQINGAGYSVTTIAQLLNRTPKAIRHLIELHYQFMKTSRAYRIADAEVTLLCRDLGE